MSLSAHRIVIVTCRYLNLNAKIPGKFRQLLLSTSHFIKAEPVLGSDRLDSVVRLWLDSGQPLDSFGRFGTAIISVNRKF